MVFTFTSKVNSTPVQTALRGQKNLLTIFRFLGVVAQGSRIGRSVFRPASKQEPRHNMKTTNKMSATPATAVIVIDEAEQLAGLVHDLNNGLMVFRGALDLARSAGNEGERRKALVLALLFLPKLQRLLNHAEKVVQGVAPSPTNGGSIEEVVTQSLTIFRLLLPENVEFYCNVWLSLWPVTLERMSVERILRNLLTNARDAMAHGGTLTVHLQNIVAPDDSAFGPYPPGLKPGRYVRLVVADTGDGIPPQVQAQLFRTLISTKPQGTGVGLKTVHDLLKRGGGDIAFHSSPSGTQFSVFFPASTPAPPA